MGRRPRSKVKRSFTENKPGSEEFRKLMEEFSEEQEIYAAYQEHLEGRNFYKMDPESRREALCTLFQ